jgi:hypothetical protein
MTEIVTELDIEPDVPVTVTVSEPGAGVADVVEMVRVGPGPPSTGVPALRLTVPVTGDTLRPVAELGVAVQVTVPLKPLRPVILTGTDEELVGFSTTMLPLVTVKVGVAVPGHVTRVVTVWPGVGSPVPLRQGANSIWLERLSKFLLQRYM